MDVTILKDPETFKAMAQEWDDLLERSSADSVYLTWEWLYTWWEVFQEGRELCLITVRDQGRLIALAPMLLRTAHSARVVPVRRLEFLGTGENPGDEVCSNYMDLIVEKGRDTEILPLLCQAMMTISWDELILKSLREDSPRLTALKDLLSAAGSVRLLSEEKAPCLYIQFSGSFDDYLMTLGQRVRRNIRKYRKLLAERGEVSYTLHDDGAVLERLNEFVAIHQQRWSGKAATDAFSSCLFTDFHHRVIPRMAVRGWVKIAFLRHQQQLIASSYHYQYKGRLYAYQVGCHDQYDRQIGTGMTEYSYSIEAAVNSGCREYDFYRSNLQGYKAWLGKDQRFVVDTRWVRATWAGRVLSVIEKLKKLKRRSGLKQAAVLNEGETC